MTEAKVFLVGAGPGDPDLLTVKAQRLLQESEVVVYDRLVSDEILGLIPSGVKCIYVGKVTGRHHMSQDAINDLLVNLASSGHRVVRLKGGDPFTFGRGSEEAQHLVRHGVDFEVVPGITAAAACSAYAGIPLTHRGVAQSVRFVTGHCRADQPLELDWKGLADTNTTIVLYMGLANLPEICEQLMAAGMPTETPTAVVENGTLSQQRSHITTLQDLPRLVVETGYHSPALIIIGEVVNFAGELSWFRPQVETVDDECGQQKLGA